MVKTASGSMRSHRLVRVDLHVHTAASFDCTEPPEFVARRCQALGLTPLFLTDHDTLDGAVHLRQRVAVPVVVGQEVTTRDGDVIGLFLEHRVDPGRSPLDTVQDIQGQGGLVYIPHPLDPTRISLSAESIDQVVSYIDILEVFNGRSSDTVNQAAADLCRYLGLVAGAGSDAHSASELGAVYIEMEDFHGRSDFLAKLRRARIITHPSRLLLRIATNVRRGVPKFQPPAPGGYL